MSGKQKLAAAAVIAVAALVSGVIYFTMTRGACAWYGYQTERTTRYAAFVGCMVKTDRGWTPRAELRTEQ